MEAKILTKNFRINSMIDISDGLAGDLKRILEESKVGAVIAQEKIPLSKYALNCDSALYDGEDYELLFTASEKEARKVVENFKKFSGTRLTPIGKIMPKKFGFRVIEKDTNRVVPVEKKGFEHF